MTGCGIINLLVSIMRMDDAVLVNQILKQFKEYKVHGEVLIIGPYDGGLSQGLLDFKTKEAEIIKLMPMPDFEDDFKLTEIPDNRPWHVIASQKGGSKRKKRFNR